MDSEDLIGIVTVTYNSGAVLTDFLRCIFSQSHQKFLLFAVDNASKDNTLQLLRECSDSRLRVTANSENLGVAAGNNQGIRAALSAGCSFVLLLNNDTEFDGDLLCSLTQGIRDHEVQMSCPKMMFYDHPERIWTAGGQFQPWAGYRALHVGEREIDRGQYDIPKLVTYVPTCCVLIKKEVFEKIGLMDERYFVYVDDTDFMYRALKAGIRLIYLPKPKLLHKVGGLTGGEDSPFQIQFGTRNRAYFLLKHFGPIYALPWIFIRALFFLAKSAVARKGMKWLRLKEISLWNSIPMYRAHLAESKRLMSGL